MFISNPEYVDEHPIMDAEHHPPPPRTTLDDVFGDPPPDPLVTTEPPLPSDMPRLEREHVTAGYRDGVNAAKGASVQDGFDEGFSLGGEVGKRVGEILGLLEGIHEAVGRDGDLVKRAREELAVDKVFGKEFWYEDGTWRFEVEKEDIIFADVAEAHPLVRKWEGIVEEEVQRWGIDLDVLGKSTEAAGEQVQRDEPELAVKPVAEAKKSALDW
ncbi:hypothetical protein VUR80DRAFT_8286 [Thermomyces stellatus]